VKISFLLFLKFNDQYQSAYASYYQLLFANKSQ